MTYTEFLGIEIPELKDMADVRKLSEAINKLDLSLTSSFELYEALNLGDKIKLTNTNRNIIIEKLPKNKILTFVSPVDIISSETIDFLIEGLEIQFVNMVEEIKIGDFVNCVYRNDRIESFIYNQEYVSKIKIEVQSIRDDLNNFKSSTNANISVINSNIASLTNSLNSLNYELSLLQNEINSLEQKVDSNLIESKNYSDSLDSATNMRIDVISGEIGNVNGLIDQKIDQKISDYDLSNKTFIENEKQGAISSSNFYTDQKISQQNINMQSYVETNVQQIKVEILSYIQAELLKKADLTEVFTREELQPTLDSIFLSLSELSDLNNVVKKEYDEFVTGKDLGIETFIDPSVEGVYKLEVQLSIDEKELEFWCNLKLENEIITTEKLNFIKYEENIIEKLGYELDGTLLKFSIILLNKSFLKTKILCSINKFAELENKVESFFPAESMLDVAGSDIFEGIPSIEEFATQENLTEAIIEMKKQSMIMALVLG